MRPGLMSKAFWLLKCCFTSTETVGLLGTGLPRTATSTFTQLLRSAFLLLLIAFI